tara:strand:- start:1566 stop:2855 length:1290 start_codon:yes stop_codon:yes gene_type:complete
MKTSFAILGLVASACLSSHAEWPEFRGPTLDGHAPKDAKFPTEWSEEKNVTWKTPLHGKGWATPVVWGDQIWLTTATDDGKQQSAICVDKNSGKILFDEILFENAEPRPLSNNRNTYASPSPVIEDGRVYVHFGSYGTACLDTKTFETLWERTDFECHHWRGPASSPVSYGDLLILTFDGADHQYLAAVDKKTGETVWKQKRSTDYRDLDAKGHVKAEGDFRKAYNTPVFIDFGGTTQMISPGAKAAWSYDPLTGKENWSLHWNEHSTASRTVFSEELGLMFFNTGYGKSQLWAVKIDPTAKGELDESLIAWKQTKRMPNRCSPILADGQLYVLSDQGVATCLDAETGEEVWSERISEIPFSASIFYGGGLLYFFDEAGKGIVVKPGDTFELVAENELASGMFASPGADGNALILRTTTDLYRIEAPGS